MEIYNIFDPELEGGGRPDGWNWRYVRVGEKIGARKLGASIYELPPGGKSFPYHYEYPNEEWLIVLTGEPTLRTPEGERRLRRGDTVCFREGPEGAHLVRNDTGEPTRIMIFSTKLGHPAVAFYPDSDKVLIATPEPDDRALYRKGDAVDYWEGEA
jgi:uncharacterized cupin superfamily protein